MKLQHKARQKEAKQEFVPAKPEKQYGFVAVAAGTALSQCSEISVLTASLRADRP